ncbi:MAG: methionine ABC transporter substrate-binding protein [Tenericutes bacterium]|nr:methionine ABC transporter substrate-binding protein [Mycoplasmatota bacterium]
MKKLLNIIIAIIAILTITGCNNASETTIRVIATSIPHGEILEVVRAELEEQGYQLEVTITSDYYFPNPSVAAGDADANFFQHVPFLNLYNSENSDKPLVIGAYVHIEPIGIYSNDYTSLDQVQDGDTVLISNSTADHGRILKLFEDAGLITLVDTFDVLSSDIIIEEAIAQNPLNLVFQANVAPDFMFSAYSNQEADLYVINSNYALEGGINPIDTAIFLESTVDNPYVNILALNEADLELDKIKALIAALNSDAVKDYINETYNGSVIPA